MTRILRISMAAVAVAMTITAARADGPGAYRPQDFSTERSAPGRSAIDAYTLGYEAVQRADKIEAAALATTDETSLKKLRKDSQKEYKAALKYFTQSVRSDDSMHEAYTYLGYTNRKLGRYDAALEAYDNALRINPDYPHAIEYQGQAYLGLNRIQDARFNYLRLYAIAPALADKLLLAMQTWVDANRGNTSVAGTEEFAAWVAQRERSAAASTSGTDGPASSW
jgi:tetratricopeptide (TPR) repeat protein